MASKMADNPRPIEIGVGSDTVREMVPSLKAGSAGKTLGGIEMMTDLQMEREAWIRAVKVVLVNSFQYVEDSSTAEKLVYTTQGKSLRTQV